MLVVDLKYKIKVNFDASHQIIGYKGPCANIHGHTYEVIVTLLCKGVTLLKEPLNMCIDFADIKKVVKSIVKKYDHQHLNNLDDFKNVQPTAEMIAMRLLQRIVEQVKHLKWPVHKVEVTVFETKEQAVSVEGLVD